MIGVMVLVALLAFAMATKQYEARDNNDVVEIYHHLHWNDDCCPSGEFLRPDVRQITAVDPLQGRGYSQHSPRAEALRTRSYYDNSTFKQLIDHNDPSLGTFDQFYYYDATYWKGPSSPVVLFIPGENNASRYYSFLTTDYMTGVIAEQIGAATIVLEHRYWGDSTPVENLTTENMKYLTVENSIKDITSFARNVQLPFANESSAADVPWIAVGGSYSGALVAWTANLEPGTLWAYYATGATVQAVSNYWSYFVPVQEGMPKNCSKDVSLVIDYMDNVLTTGSPDEQFALKAKFGMQDVAHNDDFMTALREGPGLWLANQFSYNIGFFTFCDYIEDAVNATDLPSEAGVGLDTALDGYAKWWQEFQLPISCPNYGYPEFNTTNNTRCFDTYNTSSPIFTDTALSNAASRQWMWIACNEAIEYWNVGAPPGHPTLVSRLVTVDYWRRQCGQYFPPGPNGEMYGIAAGKSAAQLNAYTGGWNPTPNATRLIYVNGQFDPWREAGVSARARPGGPLQSTDKVSIEVVPGGFHASDLSIENGEVDPAIKEVQDRILKQLVDWVKEWPEEKEALSG